MKISKALRELAFPPSAVRAPSEHAPPNSCVYWPLEKKCFEGWLGSEIDSQREITITYNDGDVEQLDMRKQAWKLLVKAPTQVKAPSAMKAPSAPSEPSQPLRISKVDQALTNFHSQLSPFQRTLAFNEKAVQGLLSLESMDIRGLEPPIEVAGGDGEAMTEWVKTGGNYSTFEVLSSIDELGFEF